VIPLKPAASSIFAKLGLFALLESKSGPFQDVAEGGVGNVRWHGSLQGTKLSQ
jgi:hypothetical protein